MSTLPGKIGKYEVIAEIGRGNMGVVYSALDPFSDHMVALINRGDIIETQFTGFMGSPL